MVIALGWNKGAFIFLVFRNFPNFLQFFQYIVITNSPTLYIIFASQIKKYTLTAN